jgi:hypothetical protein
MPTRLTKNSAHQGFLASLGMTIVQMLRFATTTRKITRIPAETSALGCYNYTEFLLNLFQTIYRLEKNLV